MPTTIKNLTKAIQQVSSQTSQLSNRSTCDAMHCART